jgi:diketogulonate reductase-like aldo/keto reductase
VRQGKVRYIGLSNLMSWQATTAIMLQERMGLEKYVTAQMYYSLVGRGLEHEFQSFAEYHNIGILVWSPLAGGFLTGKYSRANPSPAGTRFAEAGSFVPFDKEMGYRIVERLNQIAGRHGATPARVALAWVLGRPAVSSVIIAPGKSSNWKITSSPLSFGFRRTTSSYSTQLRTRVCLIRSGWFFSSTPRKTRVRGSCIQSAMRMEVLGRISARLLEASRECLLTALRATTRSPGRRP